MPKIILLDSIRSMQNVWAIFRNADGSWFEKLILTWYTPYPIRNGITKTALWAQDFIDWEYYKDPIEIVNSLKTNNYKLYSVELDKKSIDYKELFDDKQENVCLIVWNEISWVSRELINLSDKIIKIPMMWKKESLNVSVAAWIIMYSLS